MNRHLGAFALAAFLLVPITVLAADPQPPKPGPNEFEAILKAHPPQAASAPAIKSIALSNEGSASTAQWEKMEGWLTVRNVTQPAL